MSSFRDFVASSTYTIGSWLQLTDPALTEMMTTAGFDWLCIDLEHTTTSVADMGRLIMLINLGGCPALVRLSGHDPIEIKRALDAGASGIIAPSVNTADQARAIVAASRYPPHGIRGVGLARAQGYGVSFDRYLAQEALGIAVVAQIEHVEAVENLDSILAVDGIDGFFVGPYDLSASLGRTGEFEHPQVKAVLAEVAQRITPDGAVAGIHIVDPDPAKLEAAIADGYRFIAFSSEMLLFSARLAEISRVLERIRHG